MNGKIKGIIACAAIVVCLGGALAVLKLTEKAEVDNSSQASSQVESKVDKIMLTELSTEKISSVDVSNSFGTFTVKKSESGKGTWSIPALEGLNQSVAEQTSLIKSCAELKAKKMVEENANDTDKYGFGNPRGSFVINLSDGTKKSFEVGDILPEEKNYCYFREADSKTIYTISDYDVSRLLKDVKEFLNKTLIEKPTEEEEIYGKLTVQRPDFEKDMIFTDDTNESSMMSAQVMISPIYSYLNGTNSTSTTHGLWSLKADYAEVIFPKADDLKKYGLDKPCTTVLYSGNGNEYKFTIGDPIYLKDTDGNATTVIDAYYCYLEGVEGTDCIWVVASDLLPWTTVVPEDVITSVMTYNDITSLDEIVVDTEGKSIVYGIEADDEDVTSATIDGKDVNVDQFKSFYQYILTCPTSEIYSTDPQEERFLSIDIKSANGGDKLEFFKDSTTERKAIVKLNGVTSYRIPIKWTEKFVKNIALLDEGKDVEESY